MEAIKVDKVVRLNKLEIIRYQLMHHCFMKKIRLSDSELSCLSLLGQLGQVRLSEFNKIASSKAGGNILGSPIAIASCLSKIERTGLFVKKNNGKKVIFLNPDLNIQTEGNIIINLKLVKLEQANTTGAAVQKNSAKTELV